MSRHTDTYSLWKNPAITERQHRLLWMITQVLAFGLVLGLTSRLAWDHGVVASMALALRDFGVAIWSMLHDAADACSDFFQFIIR
jgi:hypothetical protein